MTFDIKELDKVPALIQESKYEEIRNAILTTKKDVLAIKFDNRIDAVRCISAMRSWLIHSKNKIKDSHRWNNTVYFEIYHGGKNE